MGVGDMSERNVVWTLLNVLYLPDGVVEATGRIPTEARDERRMVAGINQHLPATQGMGPIAVEQLLEFKSLHSRGQGSQACRGVGWGAMQRSSETRMQLLEQVVVCIGPGTLQTRGV